MISLKQAKQEFNTWKSSSSKTGKFPAHLRKISLQLLKKYTVSQLSEHLPVSKSALSTWKKAKDTTLSEVSDKEASSQTQSTSFIKLPLSDLDSDTSYTEESFSLLLPHGIKLVIPSSSIHNKVGYVHKLILECLKCYT